MKLSADLRRRGWKKGVLRDYIALSNGKGITSRQMGPDKPIPVYGSSSIIGYTDKPLIFSDSIVIGRVGACGSLQIAKSPCWVSDNSMYVSQMRREVDFDFLFFLLSYLKPGRLASRTTQPSLPQGAILNQDFLLPPLPVQERIVEILQKADEIRQKRKQALELADKILPALFLEMFGDPATNPKGWPTYRLRDILQLCDSGIWGKPASDGNKGFHVLRSTNMPLDGRIDFTDVALIEVPMDKVERYSLQEGDILLNRSSGSPEHIGKVSLFRQRPEIGRPILFSNFVQRLRVKPEIVTPEYLFFFLRSDYARERLSKLHATSSGLRNIQIKEYLAQELPVAPLPLQQYFSQVVVFYEEAWKRRADTYQSSEALFHTMLTRAFTGELTAEWEAENAEWIAERQAFYERLPQLVILALLAEKAKHARRSAEVLVTALMKYLFLVQMEGSSSRRRFYNFVPYHYGPFAKELYSDLEKLQDRGLVRVQSDAEAEKTKIILADLARIDEDLATLPDDLKQDVATIIETYGELDHTTLLNTVYEKYPAYARKSRLKRKGRGSK